MAREVNLVPDIKGEMIKTLKMRNLIFFISAVVAAASIGITLIFGLIVGGQQLALNSKKNTIDNLSAKLNSYSDLSEFITIKDQLNTISSLTENKQVMSRTFDILSVLIPTGVDSIIISELDVDLSGEQPTFNLTATANAGEEPYIDYRVLDSFKKSMRYLRYDYGNYVDKSGNTIPAYCMIETAPDGSLLKNDSNDIYAYWTINAEGCDPNKNNNNTTGSNTSYETEDYEGQQVVRIWRTPQFSEWYNENSSSNQPQITLDGQISNVPHFESSCITYTGDKSQDSSNPKWTTSNDSCWLVPAGTNGIAISESSNGRNSNEELVLSFTATIQLSPEVYDFTNSHLIALAPSGRHNVTDSYFQIQAMFGEKAAKCAEGDAACNAEVEIIEGEEE